MYLICSFSFFISAFAFYKIHKLWHKDVIENDKLYKFQVNFQSFKNWMGIVVLIIAGIVYFFKAMP